MSENQGRYVRRFCHLEHLTHQLFEIVCLVIWNAEDEIVSPVHTTCFQHWAAVHTRHHSIPLKAMFVESFHHVRRKHLTRVTSSLETLGQPSDLPFLAKVLWWYHVDHVAHFPLEERYRKVKHCNDHWRVFSLGLVARCPIQNQSHELNKDGVAANVSDLDSLVFTSVAHNRHRIAELFGSFRVWTNFGQIFLPGVDCISASSTSILASNSSSSPTSLVRPFRTSSESSFSLVLPSHWDPQSTTAIWSLLSVLRLGFGGARFCYLNLPHILLWDESCHNVDSIDHVQTTNRHLILAGWRRSREDSGSRSLRCRHDHWRWRWLRLHHWSSRNFTCWRLAWPRSFALSAFLWSQLYWWIHLLLLKVLCWQKRSRTGWWGP